MYVSLYSQNSMNKTFSSYMFTVFIVHKYTPLQFPLITDLKNEYHNANT